MTLPQAATTALLIAALVLQAVLPSARLLVVTTGAALAVLLATLLGVSTSTRLFAAVPWDVIVIVVSLGLLSELLGASRLFGLLALRAARVSRAEPVRVMLLFTAGMYVVSGLVNNLTALLLVLPVLLSLLELSGATQRYAVWTLGPLLVACNLGGAATPIGDFPAILLLGRGAMGFREYLLRAAPQTAVALATFLTIVVVVVRPARDLQRSPLGGRLAVRTMDAIYRGVRVEPSRLVPAGVALLAMLAGWTLVPASAGIGPELIAWLGAGLALVAAPGLGERLARTRVDVEAVLFLLSLFLLVGAVRDAGMFATAARVLLGLPVSPRVQLVLFLAAAAVLTGLFSAGPSMAALLEVAEALAGRLPPHGVYVGLALAVCAGSSLFLTAATSGPLAQALTERAGLQDPTGRSIRFGFFQFVPVGLLGFAVILATGLSFALLA